MIKHYQKTKEFILKNEQYLSPLLMLFGFIVDNLTLRRIDLWAENLIISSYLLVAGLCIVYVNYYDAREYVELEDDSDKSKLKKILNFKKHKETSLEKLSIFAPLVMQFAFGGLFSVFVVFYTRSSSILSSWPFLIFLLILLVGNEFFRERYQRLTFQLSIFFIAVFSYSVFALPIVVGQMGVMPFVLGGALSLVVIGAMFWLLKKIVPKKLELSKKSIYGSIGSLFLLFNILYFSNIIPPIPLSLSDDGIFHSLSRAGNVYKVEYEPSSWWNVFNKIDSDFHWKSGQPIYYYSAIFAPTKISTKINHRWSFYDEDKNEWMVKSILDYPIVGGRDGGYRGYSFKYGLEEGKWRVDVITERGQVLGRKVFRVIEVDEVPGLKEDKK